MHYAVMMSLLMSNALLIAAGHERSIPSEQHTTGTRLGRAQMIERVFVVSEAAMEEAGVAHAETNGIIQDDTPSTDESDEESGITRQMIEQRKKISRMYPYRLCNIVYWDEQGDPTEVCCCTVQ